MSITFLSHPIHLPDFSMFDREYLGKQESQNEDQKVFHKDTLEVSQLSKNRENLMDKIKHTVVHSVTSFSDMRAGILKEIREEKHLEAKTLSLLTGIDAANLCRIEQGKQSVGIDLLSKIANAMGYKIELVELKN